MAGVLPSGLGNDQQALQATAFVRQQPWYLQWLQAQGIRPGSDQQVRLNDDQRSQLYQLMLKNGIGLNNKYDEVDENGQIAEGHHKLRNTLIGAGIAGAALTGFGAAGIGPLSGFFGSAAGAAGAGTSGLEAAGGGVLSGLPGEMAALPAMSAGAGTGAGMGFLDTLKKGYDLFNSASGPISQVAGGIEKGRAEGLINQAKLQQEQDKLAQARALLALRAPGMEAANATRGDVLANSQDATISGLPSYVHVPEIGGGLRPSMLSASSRALGANMSRKAMLDNLSGADVPNLTPLPESNGYDTALQAVGQGAGFLNAASGLFKPHPASTTLASDPSQIDEAAGGTGGLSPEVMDYWRKMAMPGANN